MIRKTEREFVNYAQALLEENDFKPLDSFAKLEAGDKVYQLVRGKGLIAALIGKNFAGFQPDWLSCRSPRLDLKPNPLYESSELALLKTHYYGGIKKYHWVAQPLALHGVMIKKGGEKVEVEMAKILPILFSTSLICCHILLQTK